MYQFCHTTFSSHCFKHIPESDATLSGYILLIANQILNSRHRTKFSCIGFIVTIAYTKQQKTCLWETLLQMLNSSK